MLTPSQSQPIHGHAFLDKSKRPGLSRALVISKYPKFRAEIVSSLKGGFIVEYFSSTDAAILPMKMGAPPGVIVMDYDLLVSQSREFMRTKLEIARLREIPILVTGKVDQNQFNETVRLACRVQYLRRPFLRSQLLDEANFLVNSPIEDCWKKLPKRQKRALQNTASNFRSIARRVKKGHPLNMTDTKESCLPLMEEVLDGNAADLIENVKGHHNHTFVHSLKVATLLSLLGNAIGIKNQELLTVTVGGMLMDVGKLATSQELLNMPETLDQAQMKELQKHVLYSHNILKRTDNIPEGVTIIAEQHHEKVDGSGYPRGLKGKDLNELARLSCIADIFCALTDERPYKPAFTVEQSLKVLDKMESQLDPFLLALFKEIVKVALGEDQKANVH